MAATKYKDSGIPWIGDIPSDWEVCRLKNLHTDSNVGESIDKSFCSDNPNDTLFYTAGLKPIHTTYLDFPEWKYTQKSNLLLSRNGTPYVYIPIEGAVYSDHIIRIDINNNCSKEFVRYCLQQAIASEVVDSVSIATWSMSLWDKQILPFPPLATQQRIADYLDRKCAEIDELADLQQTMIDELKRYKQSVITEAVTKGLNPNVKMKDSGVEWIGEIPEHWEVIRIKNLLNERKQRSEDGTEEPLSMSQKYGLIPTKDMDSIPNMASTFVGAKVVYEGDLVFNKLKAHLGVFSVSKYFGLVSPDYAVYYSKNNSNAKYLEFLFKTPQYINEFKKLSTGVGSGLTRLYTSDLFGIKAIQPPIQEQGEIMNYITQKCAEIDELIAVKQQKIEALKEYKKSVIFEYVTGKKEVEK